MQRRRVKRDDVSRNGLAILKAMWNKRSNANKIMEEELWDSDTSYKESDSFPPGNKWERHGPHIKAKISTKYSINGLRDRDRPVRFTTKVWPDKNEQWDRSPPKVKPHNHGTSCFVHKQSSPSYVRTAGDLHVDEVPNMVPAPRRKSRQQLQREREAATAIQSGWKGCQVRKDIDKMNKAATQIQAAFRGYRSRKELPLGLCGRPKRQKSQKKIRVENKSSSLPSLLNYVQQWSLASATQIESPNFFLPKGKPRSHSKNKAGDYMHLKPKVTLFEIKSALKPDSKVFTYTSLNVFATQLLRQRYHDAAVTIQAAWRGFQARKKIRTLKQAKESHQGVPEEVKEQETCAKSEQDERSKETRPVGETPHIRNINIYTVVKGKPASQKPSVSIRVPSANATVQGYQRDMSRGMKGLYTVTNKNTPKPSQIHVHVNMKQETNSESCPS